VPEKQYDSPHTLNGTQITANHFQPDIFGASKESFQSRSYTIGIQFVHTHNWAKQLGVFEFRSSSLTVNVCGEHSSC
jgi:hypothetical protein